MSWYNPGSWSGDTWKRLGLDAATGGQYETYNAITGQGPSIYSGLVNKLEGDPNGIKAAYDKAIAQSQASASNIVNFLGKSKQEAQGYYAPMQHMFSNAYGTEGIQAPQVPQAAQQPPQGQMPGQSPFAAMYGAKR